MLRSRLFDVTRRSSPLLCAAVRGQQSQAAAAGLKPAELRAAVFQPSFDLNKVSVNSLFFILPDQQSLSSRRELTS